MTDVSVTAFNGRQVWILYTAREQVFKKKRLKTIFCGISMLYENFIQACLEPKKRPARQLARGPAGDWYSQSVRGDFLVAVQAVHGFNFFGVRDFFDAGMAIHA